MAAALLAALPASGQAPPGPPPPQPPAEAERPSGLLVHDASRAFPGYTLVAPLSSAYVWLIDMEGRAVHRWNCLLPGGGGLYLLDNGNLLHCARIEENERFHGGGIGGMLREFDWEGNLVWEHRLASPELTLHHDVEPLPDGNLLAIAWEYLAEDEALARGRDRDALGKEGLWPDAILELEPIRPSGARVVWEWHAADHLIQDRDASLKEYGSIPDEPGRIDINADHRDQPPVSEEERQRLEELREQMEELGYLGGPAPPVAAARGPGDAERKRSPDWLHTNAVDYHPGYDLIVVSSPEMNEIWVIDHSTTAAEAAGRDGGNFGRGGDLLYRYGNPRTYGAGTDAERQLFYQHDPQWVLDGQALPLRLTVFNNGGGRPGGDHSSVELLELPFDPESGFSRASGQAFGPAQPSWVYSDPGSFYSGFISGAQLLPNGNMLICEGADGRIFEVTRDGRVVFDYWNPFGGDVADPGRGGRAPKHALFRATRIPASHPALADRKLVPMEKPEVAAASTGARQG